MGLLLVPVNYILLAILFFSLFDSLQASIILVLVPVTGFFAYACFQLSGKLREIISFNLIHKKTGRQWKRLKN
jgi:hypothetical protein